MSGTTLAPVAQPSSEPASTPAPHRFGEDDPDVVALREAMAEAAGTVAPVAPVAPSTPAAAPEPGETADSTPPPVPYARVVQLTTANRALTEEAAYWKGVAEARANPAPAAPAPAAAAPPAPTAMDQIRAGEAALMEAVAQWEGGDLSASEMETARLRSLSQILNARDEMFAARLLQVLGERIDNAAARPGLVDAQALEVQIATLNSRHTWLQVMTDADLAALEQIAQTEAQLRGQPFPPGAAGVAKLRNRVAQLSDIYGPEWYPGTTPPAPSSAPPPTPQPPLGRQFDGTRPTPEQVRANLALQAAHPPNEPTGRASGDVALTLDRVDSMSIEQIEGSMTVDRLRALVDLPPRR